jgi:uncharacterized protein (TIGR02246 family)
MREVIQVNNKQTEGRRAGRFRQTYVARVRARARVGTRMAALLALAVFLCGPGLIHGQNNKKNKQKGKESSADASTASLLPENQALDLLVSQMLGAWQARDVESMHKFYADDVMVISGAWEPPLIGWANYARACEAQFARTSNSRLERTNSFSKVTGDTAWMTYQWQFVGSVEGKTMQAFGHTTLLLQKRAGNWLIVLNHTSAIPTDDPPAGSPGPMSGQPTSSLAPNLK